MRFRRLWFLCVECRNQFYVDGGDPKVQTAQCPECSGPGLMDAEATIAYNGSLERCKLKVQEMIREIFTNFSPTGIDMVRIEGFKQSLESTVELQEIAVIGEEVRNIRRLCDLDAQGEQPQMKIPFFVFEVGRDCIGTSLAANYDEGRVLEALGAGISVENGAHVRAWHRSQLFFTVGTEEENPLFTITILDNEMEAEMIFDLLDKVRTQTSCTTERRTIEGTILDHLPCVIVINHRPEVTMSEDAVMNAAWELAQKCGSTLLIQTLNGDKLFHVIENADKT